MFSPPATTGPGRRARRAFQADGTLLLSAGLARGAALTPAAGLSFGLVTDVHYADKDPAGTLRVEGFRRQASHDWPAPGSR